LLAALLIAQPALAQIAPDFDDKPADSVVPKSTAETIQVPSGGRPLVVTRMDGIPRQLKTAIEQSDCKFLESLLAEHPIMIFRPADGRRVMAVVPCRALVLDSRAFLFQQSMDIEPMPMTFPVVAPTGGISASSQPGLMRWDARTATLTAWRGSDVCPAREIRHTYRQGGGELNGFALSRIEHRQLRCNVREADWQTLWQSPAWNLQP
jgi:hypothetical protein